MASWLHNGESRRRRCRSELRKTCGGGDRAAACQVSARRSSEVRTRTRGSTVNSSFLGFVGWIYFIATSFAHKSNMGAKNVIHVAGAQDFDGRMSLKSLDSFRGPSRPGFIDAHVIRNGSTLLMSADTCVRVRPLLSGLRSCFHPRHLPLLTLVEDLGFASGYPVHAEELQRAPAVLSTPIVPLDTHAREEERPIRSPGAFEETLIEIG